MAIIEITEHTRTDYICANADEKPTGARPNSTLWVWDIDTYYRTPDGNIWIKTKGDNSIFASPGIIIASGQFINIGSGIGITIQSGIGVISQEKNQLVKSAFTGTSSIQTASAYINPGVAFRMLRSEIHLNSGLANSGDNFIISTQVVDGSAYYTTLAKQDLSAGSITDYVVVFGKGYEFVSGDQVVASWTNASGLTYGLRFLYEKI